MDTLPPLGASAPADGIATRDAIVVFLDLVGFTSYTDTYGDHAAFEVIRHLSGVAEALEGLGLRLIKSLGDGLLLVAADPVGAVSACRWAIEEMAARGAALQLRAAVHQGEVLDTGADVFGATVNLCARMLEHTAPGQVLVTEQVVERARSEVTLGAKPSGIRSLRGIPRPVALFTVDPAASVATQPEQSRRRSRSFCPMPRLRTSHAI